MTRVRSILSWMTVAVVASPALAAPAHYPISTEQIAAAMERTGMQVAPDQVTLLAEISASTTDPRLTVRAVESWGNHRVKARIECESSDQCLPFYVSLNMAPDAAAQAAAAVAQTYLPKASAASSAKHFVVRSGNPATLLLDGERVHIRLSVICLESGALGQTIRVTDRDRKTVFRAQVVDDGLLKGRL